MAQNSQTLNYGRMAIGAIVAGLTLFVGELLFIALMGSKILAARKAAGLPDFMPQPVFTVFEYLLSGTFIVWLYVSIRRLYGPGPLTAIRAGVASWVAIVLLSMIHMINESFGFSVELLLTVAFVVLPIYIAAGVFGAWIYRD